MAIWHKIGNWWSDDMIEGLVDDTTIKDFNIIDLSDCPKDTPWILIDPQGNQQELTTEIEFLYARVQIMKNNLEGYSIMNKYNKTEIIPILPNGRMAKYPAHLFGASGMLIDQLLLWNDRTRI